MHAEYIAISDRLLQEATTLRQCLLNISCLHPSEIPSQHLLIGPETTRRLSSLKHISIGLSKVQDLLRASQDCISLRIQEIKSSLIPINVLPTEVMRHIFTNCITATDHPEAIRVTVMNLTKVCARWREIAIHHSNLWTLLDCSWSKDLIALWTTRAGPHRALDVLIRRTVDLKHLTDDIFSFKWGSLHCGFDITPHHQQEFHSTLLNERLRGLKTLNIAPLFASFGHRHPNLKSLRWMSSPLARPNFAVLGDQLVDLSVRLWDSHELEEVFRSCVRLERLCISMKAEGLLENRTIVFPQTLENLIIGDATEDVLKRLLKVISAPNLKILSIHSPEGCFSYKDIRLIEAFFAGCPKITKLSVFGKERLVSGVICALSKTTIVLPLPLPLPADGIVPTQFLLPDLRALEICLDSVLGTPTYTVYESIGEELRGFLRARRGESDGMWWDDGDLKGRLHYSLPDDSLRGIRDGRFDWNKFYSRKAVAALESLCIAGPIDEEHKEWLMERVGTLLVTPPESEEVWLPF